MMKNEAKNIDLYNLFIDSDLFLEPKIFGGYSVSDFGFMFNEFYTLTVDPDGCINFFRETPYRTDVTMYSSAWRTGTLVRRCTYDEVFNVTDISDDIKQFFIFNMDILTK